MKIVLIFPPQCDPRQPYLAVPSLTAFLREKGHAVVQKDVNVEAFDTLLTQANLGKMYQGIPARFKKLDAKRQLDYEEQKEYWRLGQAMLFGPYVVRHIEEAKRTLRHKEAFSDLDRYEWSRGVVSRGLELISLAYYPTICSLSDYHMRYSRWSTRQITKAARDRKENLFLDFYYQYTLPGVLGEKPGLVGWGKPRQPQERWQAQEWSHHPGQPLAAGGPGGGGSQRLASGGDIPERPVP